MTGAVASADHLQVFGAEQVHASDEWSPELSSTVVDPGQERAQSTAPSLKRQLLSSLGCLGCGAATTAALHQVQPVILQPTHDVYLELKPCRRIRVIHVPEGLPFRTAYLGETSSRSALAQCDGTSSDDEDYWFENADPIRPQILPMAAIGKTSAPRRIFHKFAPQERAAATTPSIQDVISPGRLPRKKFVVSPLPSPEDQLDGEADQENKTNGAQKAPASEPPKRNELNHVEEHHEESSSEQVKQESVITIPFPGESSTDADSIACGDTITSDDNVGGLVVSHLGGFANIGFEGEEDDDALSQDKADAGYKRSRDIGLILDMKKTVCKPMLFFIHGVGASADIWNNQMIYFSLLGYEVIAPDLLGHGLSSTPDAARSYTFKKLLQDLLTIFDHFTAVAQRPRFAAIVAHSYGCSLATALAKSRPDTIKMLIMIASGGPTPIMPPASIRPHSSKLWSCFKPLFRCGLLRRRRVVIRGKNTRHPEVLDVPGYVLNHVKSGQYWPEGDLHFHRRLTTPTLLVYGLKDELVSLVEMCEMERTLPKAYLELVPLAGHFVMQDQPKALNQMMKKFLEKYSMPLQDVHFAATSNLQT